MTNGDASHTARVICHDTPGDAGPRHRQDTRISVTRTVSRAVILAAGNGDRFHNPTHESKLLQPLLGQPILLRTLEAAYDAGIRSATVVLGYQAARVRALVEAGAPRGLHVSFALNPEWRLENGVSAQAARASVGGDRFALLMGDHIFEPPVLQRMLRLDVEPGESLLAIDARPVPREVADEATKVRREGSRIVAIGKDLVDYDALDTGVFVFSPVLFDALDRSRARGDTTLSGGVRQLAARGLMRGVEIGDATWCDIDTVSDLAAAESALGAPSA
jgi:choline kinase